jgi:hypothetical protein
MTNGTFLPSEALGLHVCPGCSSKLVQPLEWEQASDRSHWRVWRRCPDCELVCDGVHAAPEIDAFDEQLDLGTRLLADELKALTRENMAQIAETFAIALAADLITADDF